MYGPTVFYLHAYRTKSPSRPHVIPATKPGGFDCALADGQSTQCFAGGSNAIAASVCVFDCVHSAVYANAPWPAATTGVRGAPHAVRTVRSAATGGLYSSRFGPDAAIGRGSSAVRA